MRDGEERGNHKDIRTTDKVTEEKLAFESLQISSSSKCKVDLMTLLLGNSIRINNKTR